MRQEVYFDLQCNAAKGLLCHRMDLTKIFLYVHGGC
jgi:hypothetical protein